MSDVQDAMQVLNVSIQGIEVCFRIAKEMMEALQKLVKFLSNMLFQEKLLGKTNMKTMLKQGVDLEVCQIPENRMKEFQKLAKKYGILYTVVPGGKNGLSDVLFRKEDIPRMNLLFERMGLGKLAHQDIMDYVKNLSDEQIHDIAPENKEVYPQPERVADNRKQIETSKEIFDGETVKTMEGIYREAEDFVANAPYSGMSKEELNKAVQNIRIKALSNHPSYEEISIATKENYDMNQNWGYGRMLVDETREQVKIRIPYEKDKFVWLDKKEAFISEDRKKVTAFLKRDREYDIVDKNNQKVESMKGKDLRREHFTTVHRQKNQSKSKEKQQSRNQKQSRTQEKNRRTKSK